MTNVTARVDEKPLFFSQVREGIQIIAMKIDRNSGFKIGAAAFMPAIIIQIAAKLISRWFFCVAINNL